MNLFQKAPKPYYQDELVTLYCGDSKELMPQLEGLVITDPPYNVGYHYSEYRDNLDVETYRELLKITCRLPSVVIHYAEDLCELSWVLEEIPSKIVAWVYPSNTARQWRGIGWWGVVPDFTRDGQEYRNPQDGRIAKRIANGEQARLYDWWEINQVKNVAEQKTEHPCQIPLDVMTRIIKITPNDSVIIDPFAGSGTTLLAAKLLNRRVIGIELSEEYCEIAAKRCCQSVMKL